MDLHFEEKTFPYLRCILKKNAKQEQSSECIIPDSCPDAVRVLNTSASVCIREKECTSGSVTVSGELALSILYVGEDEKKPYSVQTMLPIRVTADAPEIGEDAQVFFCPTVRSAEARLLNSRKLFVRVTVGYSLGVYLPSEEATFCAAQMPQTLQCREATYGICIPAEFAEKCFPISDTIFLPPDQSVGETIHFVDLQPEISEKKIVGTKAVFKGVIRCKTVFDTTEGRLERQELTIPFSQYCELSQTYEEAEAQICLCLCDVRWQVTQNRDGIDLAATMIAQCLICSNRSVAVFEDAYCTDGELAAEWKNYELSSRLDSRTETAAVTAFESCDAREVVEAIALCGTPAAESADGAVTIAVPSECAVLYRTGEGSLQCVRVRSESVFSVKASDETQIFSEAAVLGAVSAIPNGSGIEIRYTVALTMEAFADCRFRTLCAAEREEPKEKVQRPAAVIRRVGDGETLWSIAKQYRTTTEKIKNANQISDEPPVGSLLLIPM